MKRNRKPRTSMRLRLESLEDRRLLAVAAFQMELYSDNAGVPGTPLVDGAVTAGDTFFLRVTAEEFDPYRYGLGSAAIDIDWDAVLLDVVESDFDLESVITADLPLFRSGTLDNAVGRIDELSGTAMLSGGAGRAIGNMRPETFALIRMQAGDQAGTASIQLSKSETKTITVPSMVLQDQHLRFDTQTITIVAPSVTDSTTAVGELPNTAVGVQPPTAPPQTEAAESSAPPTASPAALNFDANHDGVFDLADFGWLNQQAAASDAALSDSVATSPPRPTAPPAEPQAESTLGSVKLPFEHPTTEVRHTCIPMVHGETLAAEAWLDALAEAWLEDAKARRRRHGVS